MSYIIKVFEYIIVVLSYWPSAIIATIKALIQFAKKAPGQVLAPIGVLICSILMMTVANDTIFDGPLMGLQGVLLVIQFRSLYRTIKATRILRRKEDRECLKQFFESASLHGIPGSVRFLSIYKDWWLRARYYKLRGITRLSLYRFGNIDEIGSHTKFQVTKKDFFHLQLKGCIDTEDPNRAVEGINFLANDYLTK